MKRVLFVATVDMYTRTGGGLATKAYYNAFKAVFQGNLDLIHAEDYFQGEQSDSIILQSRPSTCRRLGNLLRGHLHRFYPFLIEYLFLNRNKYECCIINGGVFAGDSILQIQSWGIKVWVIHHNFERQYHILNKTVESYGGLSCYWINKWERIAYLNANVNLFLTQYDMDIFAQNYGRPRGRCFLTGCFEAVDKSLVGKLDNPFVKSLVISGALNFPQTEKAIVYFLQKYFNLLEQRKFTLLVTGRNPSDRLVQMIHEKGAQIVASPDDIDSVICSASIYLCPISDGGGFKLRIMDGLRLGMPVIAHVNSMRGYEMLMERPYFVSYNSTSSFVEGLHKIEEGMTRNLLNSKEIQKDYITYFSLSAGVRKILSIYKEVSNDIIV
ncbi:glycosyltransferase [uncultured Bacteroides sp.]|uniref:glycosyltransferase n=1 Tax=uncultured Bacteroides sp. TaxID=162156 RepID=UPI00262058A9|nr:glycosyltransferase [uncultured Bacteroides sp.]